MVESADKPRRTTKPAAEDQTDARPARLRNRRSIKAESTRASTKAESTKAESTEAESSGPKPTPSTSRPLRARPPKATAEAEATTAARRTPRPKPAAAAGGQKKATPGRRRPAAKPETESDRELAARQRRRAAAAVTTTRSRTVRVPDEDDEIDLLADDVVAEDLDEDEELLDDPLSGATQARRPASPHPGDRDEDDLIDDEAVEDDIDESDEDGADEDDRPARRPRPRRPRSRLNRAVRARLHRPSPRAAAVGILIIAVLGALVYSGLRIRHDDQMNSLRASAIKQSQAYAVDMATYNYQTLDADFGKVMNESTASFRNDFNQSSNALKSVFTQFKATGTGKALGGGVVSLSSSRAVVLVAVNQTVNSTQAKNPQSYSERLEVTLARHGDKWLIQAVQVL